VRKKGDEMGTKARGWEEGEINGVNMMRKEET